MNKLQATLLALAAGMSSTAAFAEEPYVKLYANPDEIKAESGVAEVEIWYDTDITMLNAMDFRLYVPVGFSIQKDEYDDFDLTVNTAVSKDYMFTVGDHLDEEPPYYIFVGFSMKNRYLATGANRLVSFNLVVPADFDTKKYPEGVDCRLETITIAEDLEPVVSHHPDTFVFHITPTEVPTGVDEIGEAGGDEAIYTLEGFRVHEPLEPGTYIVKGDKGARKIIVK